MDRHQQLLPGGRGWAPRSDSQFLERAVVAEDFQPNKRARIKVP
jgi:hypothetical protein